MTKNTRMPGHAKRGAAAIGAVQHVMARGLFGIPVIFTARGFSDRTIKALVDCSVDAPERLLFMDEQTIRSIPGIGQASMNEILAYRAKFLRG